MIVHVVFLFVLIMLLFGLKVFINFGFFMICSFDVLVLEEDLVLHVV